MTNTIVVTNDVISVISAAEQGPSGPPGVKGDKGDQGIQGSTGLQGPPGDSLLTASTISPVLGSDLVPIIRGNTIYLATVADVLDAQGIDPAGSQLDFSQPANSGLYPFFF